MIAIPLDLLALVRLLRRCFFLELFLTVHEPGWMKDESLLSSSFTISLSLFFNPFLSLSLCPSLYLSFSLSPSLTFSSRALWWSNSDFSALRTSTSELTPALLVCRLTTVILSDRSCLATRHSRCSNRS